MNQHVPLNVVLVKVIKELRLSKRNEDAHRDNYRGFRKEGEQQLSLPCRSYYIHLKSLCMLQQLARCTKISSLILRASH
jgi:hypothetical protein